LFGDPQYPEDRWAAGILDQPITEDEVIQAAKLGGGNFARLLREIISGM
jgi:purine nucleoside phosphorylase